MTLNTSDLRAKAEAATAGPWEWREDTTAGVTMRTLSPGVLVLDGDPGCGGPWGDNIDRANAEYIAAANPATMRALLDLLEEAEGALEGCVHTIEAMRPTFAQAKDEGHAYHDQIADQARTTLAKIRSAR
jgi:hypothetical protein